jgi:hypothetical protein
MATLRESCTAFAPASLERSPPLPTPHPQGLSAIPPGRSGAYGHRLSLGPRGEGPPRVTPACGHRPYPQGPQHKTPQWRQYHLAKQRPGPHCLMTCTVPAPLRPRRRAQPRPAYQALLHASATARHRLAHDERGSGTALPGGPGGLQPWGRPRPYHPHIHAIVPAGGLSTDRRPWCPSRTTFFGPGTALSPISRALFTAEMPHAGRLEPLAPPGWTIPWNVHRQAKPHRHSAGTALAPSVFRGARPPRRQGVSPAGPAPRLARGRAESPPRRLAPGPRCRPARAHPSADRARPPACGPAVAPHAPPTVRNSRSDWWPTAASRQAGMDLTPPLG